jgi:hypothetical protein
MTLTPEQVAAVAGIIGAVVVAGIRKVWVWGWVFAAMEVDRNYWRDLAMSGTAIAEDATTIALRKRDA